ncbi:MAG: M61 family metallopeptidase [Planctomycetes bacterium]|nr:M61 family metallopeptidase [Planctomycetota bacterium]
MPAGLSYTLEFLRPRTHLVDVRLLLRGLPAGPVELAMPAWTPGSYKIRDFAKGVQELSARDARGRGLRAPKLDKSTWRLERGGGGTVEVRYRVYAHELTVRTSHVDEEHAYLNGASIFLYVKGRKELPVEVRLRAPRGWRLATSLPPVPGRPATFQAPDYDTLVDCPIEAGLFETHAFTVRGRRHRLVIHGRGNYDAAAIVADLRRIVHAEARLFGGLPYKEYLFLLHPHPDGGGGLEHRTSCSLQFPRFQFRPREKYEGFLSLCAHEFFHLWNVKRIRPAVLGPFDYQSESYTRLLWVMEGITSYYDKLLLRRAGLLGVDGYLKKAAEAIQKVLETPGRRVQSVEEAGFDAWIRLYQPNEHTANSTVSYYEKGQVVGLLLDLRLRAVTGGRRSLDDVLRLLWREHGKPDRGFEEAEFQSTVERVAGRGLEDFFEGVVRSVEDPDWNAYFRPFGLEWRAEEKGEPRPLLGARTEKKGDRVTISGVVPGGPAERDGLAAGDEVLAVNGFRVDGETFEKRLEEAGPGGAARLAVFRKDELRTLTVRLGVRREVSHALARRARTTAAERRLLRGWLGREAGPFKVGRAARLL